jgi:hypothetical protein
MTTLDTIEEEPTLEELRDMRDEFRCWSVERLRAVREESDDVSAEVQKRVFDAIADRLEEGGWYYLAEVPDEHLAHVLKYTPRTAEEQAEIHAQEEALLAELGDLTSDELLRHPHPSAFRLGLTLEEFGWERLRDLPRELLEPYGL